MITSPSDMSFVSISFVVFFPVVTTLYFLFPPRYRWALLLSVSAIFYMAFVPVYILVLLGLILVDYTAGLLLELATGRKRTYILLVSILSMCGILFVFKYFNFFNTNLSALAQFLGWHYSLSALSLALPLGLSFHTFQSLSYVIEVYRGKQKAERHLGIYALYVLFYPQLVAGPIERPQHLLPQFRQTHTVTYEQVKTGLIRMAWGFFKKMVVADHLALFVNHIFANPTSYEGLPLIIASVFFTLQLYFDFSAYCDIALGAAQVMGFTLMENFNRPFISTTISEFWRRWHISLSSWFRDYLYIPLGGNRVGKLHWGINILIVFAVSGLWHGANWTFVVFGLLHGLYIIFGIATQQVRQWLIAIIRLDRVPRFHHALQVTIIFAGTVIGFIFFRAQNVSDGWYIVANMPTNLSLSIEYLMHSLSVLGASINALLVTVVLTIFVLWCEYIGRNSSLFAVLAEQKWQVRWLLYWGILGMMLLLSENTASRFIYFQF